MDEFISLPQMTELWINFSLKLLMFYAQEFHNFFSLKRVSISPCGATQPLWISSQQADVKMSFSSEKLSFPQTKLISIVIRLPPLTIGRYN